MMFGIFVYTTTGLALDSPVFATAGYFPGRKAVSKLRSAHFHTGLLVSLYAIVLDKSGNLNPTTYAKKIAWENDTAFSAFVQGHNGNFAFESTTEWNQIESPAWLRRPAGHLPCKQCSCFFVLVATSYSVTCRQHVNHMLLVAFPAINLAKGRWTPAIFWTVTWFLLREEHVDRL